MARKSSKTKKKNEKFESEKKTKKNTVKFGQVDGLTGNLSQ